jgi:flagella basal body P-ring formation protein FlgA
MALSARSMVQSGDVVAVRSAGEGVSVEGQAVAQQSGSEGDVIRAVNKDSRRALKVRVVAPGRVEVVQ